MHRIFAKFLLLKMGSEVKKGNGFPVPQKHGKSLCGASVFFGIAEFISRIQSRGFRG